MNAINDAGYRIWRVAFGQSDFLEITADEYSAIERARRTLNEESYLLEKFFAVSESYKTVEIFIYEAALNTMLGRQVDIPGIRGVGAEFGRITGLLLSSIRLYQDTVGSHLREIINDPDGVKIAKSFMSEKYDCSFYYRFMESVRNYAQHRSFPIHGAKYGGKLDLENDVTTYDANFYFTAEKVTDEKFKAAILGEVFAQQKGQVDLKVAVRTYVADICDVNERISKLCESSIGTATSIIAKWREAWLAKTGDGKLVGVAAVRFDGNVLDKDVPKIFFGPQMDEYGARLKMQTARLRAMHNKRVQC